MSEFMRPNVPHTVHTRQPHTVQPKRYGSGMRISDPPSPLWLYIRSRLEDEGIDVDSLSLDRLKKLLPIGRGSVQRILEDGHSNQRAETIEKLARRFKQSPSEFVASYEKREPNTGNPPQVRIPADIMDALALADSDLRDHIFHNMRLLLRIDTPSSGKAPLGTGTHQRH